MGFCISLSAIGEYHVGSMHGRREQAERIVYILADEPILLAEFELEEQGRSHERHTYSSFETGLSSWHGTLRPTIRAEWTIRINKNGSQ